MLTLLRSKRGAHALLGGAVLSLLITASLAAQEARFLRHILVRSEPIADAIIANLDQGGDFKALARKYSLDVGTKPLGGDLDWTVPASLEPEFARVAWAIAEKGGYTKVKTRHGWHVVEYVDSRPAPEARPVPPPAPAKGQPGQPPIVAPPVTAPANEDLAVTLSWPKTSFLSGEPIRFSIEIRNTTDAPIDVFHPDLWPLGLIVRYQFGRLNQSLGLPESWNGVPPGGTTTVLGEGESLHREFTLQDYCGERPDWPIVRVIWRGDRLFASLEKLLPTVVEAEEYPARKGRWRFYMTPESRVSILPEYHPGDRWLLCVYSRGRTWIEIRDPGIPGVVERFLDSVTGEVFDGAEISQFTPTDYYAAVAPRSRGAIPFSEQPATAIGWAPGTVGLAIEWDGQTPVIGDSLCFALERPDDVSKRAIPIGRVVLGEGDPQPRILELLERGQPAPISLVLAYPWDLAPEAVREAAGALPEPGRLAQKLRPDPSQQWKSLAPKRVEGARPGRLVPKGKDDPDAEHDHDREVAADGPPLAIDLPRVELLTSSGRITIELYEDDAPNTVANFIHLVTTGFYRSNQIIRRESNPTNRGFIQTGSPDNTKQGTPGYSIADERNGRPHVRGALSMARKHSVPDSGGSQFFICLDGQPQLDPTYTVFGHVIDGMDVVDRLQLGHVVHSMEVIRKREHEYTPVTIPR